MKIISCVLLFAAVHGNIALQRKKELPVHTVKSLMDQLIAINEFDVTREFTKEQSCKDLTFSQCYREIHEFYQVHLSEVIYGMFKESIANKLKAYITTILVMLSGKFNNLKIAEVLEDIHLKDSKMHCVIGVLSLHPKIGIDDLLSDYTFFGDFELLKEVQGIPSLKKLISNHLGERMFDTTEIDGKHTDYKSIKGHLNSLKANIDKYSMPFCKLQTELRLDWIDFDSWTWKRLKNSAIIQSRPGDRILDIEGLEVDFETDIFNKQKYTYFDGGLDFPLENESIFKKTEDSSQATDDMTKDTQDSLMAENPSSSKAPTGDGESTSEEKKPDHRVEQLNSILEWKISSADHEERVKKLPPIKTERNNNDTPIKMDSMNNIIKKHYQNPKFDGVEKFYHTVGLAMDLYVSKVLFRKVIHIATNAMTMYYKTMQNKMAEETREDHYFNQFYVGEHLLLFKYALEMYFTIHPFTFHANTAIDMLKILDFVIKSYAYHMYDKQAPSNPEETVNLINGYLNDIRFKQESVSETDVNKLVLNKWDDVNNAISDAVLLMIHFSEIKKQKVKDD